MTKNAILTLLLLAGLAYAGSTIRNQDLPPDLAISNSFEINGVRDFGLLTNTEICGLTCTAGIGACKATSSTEGDMYRSTGTVVCQFRNSRTGKGP